MSPLLHFQFANPLSSSPVLFVLDLRVFFSIELILTTQRTTSNQHHMRLAFCILLFPSVFYFALTAPVAVGEALEVRSNVVGFLSDEIAAWEKRMDTDDQDNEVSTKQEVPV